MGIIKLKELNDSIVDADIAPRLEITAIDQKPLETKEWLADAEPEVSGRELLIAGLVVLALAGLALWLMLGR